MLSRWGGWVRWFSFHQDCLVQFWLPDFKSHTINIAAEYLGKMGKQLQDMVPPFGHIATATKYVPTLAKKQLLMEAPRAEIANLIDKCDSLSTSLTSVAQEFGIDPKTISELLEVDAITESGKLAMAVIAAVSVIEEQAMTQSRVAFAAELLTAKGLPEAIRSRLRPIAAAGTA